MLNLLFLILFSFSALAQQGVQRNGNLQKVDSAFGKLAYGLVGKSCDEATKQEVETVDCQIKSFNILNTDEQKDYQHLVDVLIFNEAAREAYISNQCQANFFSHYQKHPEDKTELGNLSYQQYQVVKKHLDDGWKKMADLTRESFAKKDSDSDGLNLQNKLQDEFKKQQELISSIPLGNRPIMRKFYSEAMAKNYTEAQFKEGFDKAMLALEQETKGALNFFKKKSYQDPTDKNGVLFNIDNSLKKSLVQNGLVENVVTRNQLADPLKDKFMCRMHRDYETGPIARMLAEVAVSAVVPYGAAGLALKAAQFGARSAEVANFAKLAVVAGTHAVEFNSTWIDVKDSCFPPEYMTSKLTDTCDPLKQTYEIFAEAQIASCLMTGSLGVALPFVIQLSRIKGGLKAAKAVAATAEKVDEGEDIVVVAPRVAKASKTKKEPAHVESAKKSKKKKANQELPEGMQVEAPETYSTSVKPAATQDLPEGMQVEAPETYSTPAKPAATQNLPEGMQVEAPETYTTPVKPSATQDLPEGMQVEAPETYTTPPVTLQVNEPGLKVGGKKITRHIDSKQDPDYDSRILGRVPNDEGGTSILVAKKKEKENFYSYYPDTDDSKKISIGRGNATWPVEALGKETADYFGAKMIKPNVVSLPDPNTIDPKVKLFNNGLKEEDQIPIEFYEASEDAVTNTSFLTKLFQGLFPFAMKGSQALHDRTFHLLPALIMPKRYFKHFAAQRGLVLEFLQDLKKNNPKAFKSGSYKVTDTIDMTLGKEFTNIGNQADTYMSRGLDYFPTPGSEYLPAENYEFGNIVVADLGKGQSPLSFLKESFSQYPKEIQNLVQAFAEKKLKESPELANTMDVSPEQVMKDYDDRVKFIRNRVKQLSTVSK